MSMATASLISSLTASDWSPTWLLNSLLKLQFLFQSSYSSACNGIPATPPLTLATAAATISDISSSGSQTSTAFPVEMVALGQIFDHFDENKDGKISCGELRRSLNMLGIETDDEELTAMINDADSNSDGYLGFSGFASFYYSLNEGMGQKGDSSINNINIHTHEDKYGGRSRSCGEDDDEETYIGDAFKLFDKDGNGYICAEELQSVLASMGLSQGKQLADCRNMIRSVDEDGDGQVSLQEFKHMMVAGFGQS